MEKKGGLLEMLMGGVISTWLPARTTKARCNMVTVPRRRSARAGG
jgi:hypothetical protein